MGDSKKQKQYLTGTVHRLNDGNLESHYAGEEAPEWVTNPKVLTDQKPGSEQEQGEPAGDPGTPPAGDGGNGNPPVDDDLTPLDGKALKAMADELKLKKSGSLDDIRGRIRAKRAEGKPVGDQNAERDALIEKLKEKSIEFDSDATEVELQALLEQGE